MATHWRSWVAPSPILRDVLSMRTHLCLVALLFLTGCPDSDSAGGSNLDRPDAGSPDASGDTGGEADASCTPVEEACNGEDDDCDGVVDNGFDLAGDTANCGGCGRVCALPNALPACNAGECVVTECEEGWFDVDGDPANGCESEDCVATGDEVCDGADNDCDGSVDEDFDIGSNPEHCAECGDVCAVPGATAACDSGVCVIESCDEGRGDANGEEADGCECTITNEAVEACDGVDNDCNGDVDDDIDLTVPERCGACDNVCAYANGVPACEDMQCVLADCLEGYYDIDERAETGCEYACDPETPSDTDLACDGEDNDCDGEVDNGTGEGEPCTIADGVDGVLTCGEGGLQCVIGPSEEPVELCGEVMGHLTAEGGPYIIVCPEVVVPDGAELSIADGASVSTGLAEDAPVVVSVAGSLSSAGAAWRGVSIRLDGGEVALVGDELEALGGQVLLDAAGPGTLSATGARLGGDGVGIAAEGDASRLTLEELFVSELAVGVDVRTETPLTLTECVLENNSIGARVDTAAPGAGVVLEGGAIRFTIGPPQIGIDIDGDERDAVVSFLDTDIAARDIDEVARLDPDQLRGLSGTATVLSDVPNRIYLRGALDRADAEIAPLGDLVEFAAPEGLRVSASRTLSATEGTLVLGTGGALAIEGTLVGGPAVWRDLLLRPTEAAITDLTGTRVEITLEGLEGCLLEAPPEATLTLDGAVLMQEPLGTSVDLHGICVDGATEAAGWSGATVRGFATGLRLVDAGGFDITGLTLEDNLIGLDWHGAAPGTISGNAFVSTPQRQVVSVRLRTGAEPGGAVSGNTVVQDVGDFFLDIDPDCLSEGGTAFGPNTFDAARPGAYLLGGRLDGGVARVGDITGRAPEDAFFLTVQVPEDIVVADGAQFIVDAGEQIVSLQGLSTARVVVEGELELRGPGLLVSELPVAFEAGSEGVIAAVSLSGSRTDAPLVSIDDSEPTIGGNSRFDEVQITGSNLGDVIGVEISSTNPMCQVLENLCPFIANNVFRNLSIGVLAHRPAFFSGVNDFDDADGDDSVPVNVEQR